ncbi:MAG: flagellar FliJ family protein [Micavibrio sp.]|nr:flagellar FliJ family protein [Micavibrio sp.]
MADLSVLIRLHKHELDEKRRALNELYNELALLEQKRQQLEAEFNREKEAASAVDDIHYTFPRYAEKVQKKREELQQAAGILDIKVEKAKDDLMESFSELKKYEMTQDERDRLEREEQLIKENEAFDAIALEGFRRRKQDE